MSGRAPTPDLESPDQTAVESPPPERSAPEGVASEMTRPGADGVGSDPVAGGRLPQSRVRWRRSRWAALAAGLVVAGLAVALALAPNHAAVQADSPLLGHPAPPLRGPSLTSNRELALSDFQGQFVLVDFFASWCVVCHAEAANLESFYTSHSAGGAVTVLGVAFDDTPSAARNFLATTGASWPAIADPGGMNALAWGVRAPPEAFLVAPDREVVAKWDGPITPAAVDAVIARAEADGL